MTDSQDLKILFVEDVPEDLELAKRKIKSSGLEFESFLAEKEDEFLKGLYEFKPDIIISDYMLPEFDGMRALELALTYNINIPFIILTGSMNEEIAVEAMKAGATDYILKERISRLPFAIREAIDVKKALVEKKIALNALKSMSEIVQQSPFSVISTNLEGIITSWNKGAERIFGYTSEEALGRNVSILYHKNDFDVLQNYVIEPLLAKGYNQVQVRLLRKGGELFIGSLSLWVVKDGAGNPIGMVGYTYDITKEVEAENELRIKDQAIESDIDGIVLVDLNGNLTYANSAACSMWGYADKEEVIGKKITDFLASDEDGERILNELKEHAFKSEFKAVRKDGSEFPVWLSASRIRDSDGKIVSYMGSLVDYTEKKKAEDALETSEQMYRLLAENTLDCIWSMDMNLNFTYGNHAVYNILGYLPEEWIGSNLKDHCDEENFNKMKEYIGIGMQKAPISEGIRFQVDVLNKEGHSVPVEIIGKLIFDENGAPVCLQGTTRDVTKRVEAENALKESEERLELALRVSEHGFWVWDLDQNDFYFNPKAYTMLGYEDNEFPMSIDVWSNMMHPDDRKQVIPEIINCVNKRKPFSFEIRMTGKSSDWIWVLVKGNTFNLKSKKHWAIGTLVDITERKKTEEQMLLARIAAEEANRCKNELLANMNHELRTPLNSIIGFSDVLLTGSLGQVSAEQEKYLRLMNNEGHRLLSLINHVLDLSKIESDGITLNFSNFDPVLVAENVMESTEMLAKKKNIRASMSTDRNIGTITADVDKFREILYNLIENALKFTPQSGNIVVVMNRKDEEIEVSVQDTGIGIAEEDRERIFDAFVQVDGSTTRRYGGAGLGLVLVREYLKMHNGCIRVESEAGKGSKFIFKIPVYPVRKEKSEYKTPMKRGICRPKYQQQSQSPKP
ncbi:PAS domain S-box [Methanolobus tindarius DSM 2278]|uniref:histidine kinase n=1 Tax=Methanolobus tindarius DSM 2278 TaxID=1090322 RepID=W9DZT5_METTI|nr:PAS domain S-box protein [Methanolobus tindarius]ETA69202.1 PAS domain S-box [Methanolobus tindarius DSM 2278]